MYCKNCGREISDNATVCPHCGTAPYKNDTVVVEQKNTLAIVGFILSFFVPVVGLILSIVGIRKSAELNGNGKKLAIAGIIISIVSLVINIIVSILWSSILSEYIYELIYGLGY